MMYQATFKVGVTPSDPNQQIFPDQSLVQKNEDDGEFVFFATTFVAGFCPCNARQFLNAAMEEFPASEYSNRRACLVSFTSVEASEGEDLSTVIFTTSNPTTSPDQVEDEFVDVPCFPLKDKRFRAGVQVRWQA